jgi:(E)-4-hydroxy-3-methylbut-2-enyl-diphosphate synthase
MGLRSFTPMVIACPGCGRTTSTYFQELAQAHPVPHPPSHARVAPRVHGRRGHDRRGHGLRRQRPRREQARQHRHQPARHRRAPVAPVYEDGEKTVTLKGEHIAEEFQEIVEKYIKRSSPAALRARNLGGNRVVAA